MPLERPERLSGLSKNDEINGFQVANLYSDRDGTIVGAKFWHLRTGAPVYLLQIETAPQAYIWVDTPVQSNAGLPHSLEHLLSGKGTKGRYATLLTGMHLSISAAATTQDFNFYEFCSGTGMEGFYKQLHPWLDALFRSDFTDLEAEREFYHFGVTTDPATKQKALVEQGTVYNEQQTNQGIWTFYYQLNRRVLGVSNPFGFNSSGLPDAMRDVTPDQIRSFYRRHYRLGPGTGFIFVVSPKESLSDFLGKVSNEFNAFAEANVTRSLNSSFNNDPKYAIHSSGDFAPELYPFPAETEAAPGQIRFAWKPTRTESLLELKLLQLFARTLADGEQSPLYASLVDQKSRLLETGATSVYSDVFLANSPHFPVVNIGFSGIPGDHISKQQVEGIRNVVLRRISEIAGYPNHSPKLISFNHLVAAHAKSWSRSEDVWTRNAPLFGYLGSESKWKDHFEYLELDSSFVHSLTTEGVWRDVDTQLDSGMNIWHELIEQFGLLNTPYATASIPSPRLLEDIAAEEQRRISDKTRVLMEQYQTNNPQEALSLFEGNQVAGRKEIQAIEASVPKAHFTENPPLTRDDDIQYQRVDIAGSEGIAAIFEKPPTVDVGFSFDLHNVPKRYYKYLAILPQSLDSLGLRQGNSVLNYSELLTELQHDTYKFTAGFDSNALSKRAEFSIRLSATSVAEFRTSLELVQRMISSSNLTVENLSRLEDIVERNLSTDDSYTKQAEENWIANPATALRYQDDSLFVALNSHFAQAHWDERLRWLFHATVSKTEITQLGTFAHRVLFPLRAMSRERIRATLSRVLTSSGVQRELVEYWRKNLYSFPERQLVDGFLQLVAEVQQDLRTGPAQAIADLKYLRQLVFKPRGLRLDFTLDEKSLVQIRPDVERFIRTLEVQRRVRRESVSRSTAPSISARLKRRYPLFNRQFPFYVAFPYQGTNTGAVVFTAKYPGYNQLDHNSLVQMLASKAFSGAGPQSFYMKTWDVGLAYNNGVAGNPGTQLLTYYADRSPDLTALLEFVNSLASADNGTQDQTVLDYLFSQAFPLPRSMLTFSQRGVALVRDIRDGNDPEKIRRFSSALLKLRQDPHILVELSAARTSSIGGILVGKAHVREQQSAQSIFFFVGSEKTLSDAEKHLGIPKLLRLWPSDYWVP